MGIQPPEVSSSKTAAEASPYTRTRSKSKSATTPAPKSLSKTKNWERLDEDLSILSSPAPKSVFRKRKTPLATDGEGEMQAEDATPQSSAKKRKMTSPKKKEEEKRLRHFRSRAPGTYLQRLERARSQRMFVINRTRNTDNSLTPSETISMAGTTGNIYDITITHIPHCTCPDNRKGNQCKHIVYVLHNVLKAPEHLQYQLAFLTSELQLIFDQAPLPPTTTSSEPNTSHHHENEKDTPSSNNRKEITGDCPICFMEFDPPTEEIIYCKAACGNNIHKDCFDQWARAQPSSSGVKCVYCRTPWQKDVGDYATLARGGKKGEEGYVNIGEELGLSGVRDVSSYHPFWVRKQMGRGGGRWEGDYDYDD
ncbi:MAG: hypothetical protein LQ339_003948 [Xanthoria mediterranea]|nr:MAG: hypothetical protein LQ339_003948 [Xanthoria mediterranea]